VSEIAIVGVNTLGGSLAHKIATRGRFDRISLIDTGEDIAAGTALDIQQTAAIEPFQTTITSHTDLSYATQADVVVLTQDLLSQENENSAIATLAELGRINRQAVFLCASHTHRNIVNRGALESGIARQRLIGTAPAAIKPALQALIALELNTSPSEISLAVLGTPPEHIVIPWNSATVGGLALKYQFSLNNFSRFKSRTKLLWPPGPYAIASVTTRICEAVISGAPLKKVTCFVELNGEFGVKGSTTAVPIDIDRTGITNIVEPVLTQQERTQLGTALSIS
tara:strand:- start:54538 stop:55383 length:846 start_codon:yes stop_codon:yes gene_type:complete